MLLDGELERADEMRAALATREISPLDLLERSVRRAEAWQPVVNGLSQLRTEPPDAAAGRAIANGIPVAVKDLFDVAGGVTSACCRAYRDNVAPVDSPIVARLRSSGVSLIGKANQHELSAGATNLVSAFGPVLNPWDRGRISGGSSGGSAALVAAGVAPLALGSDTGGSVRIPAAFCGVYGLKATIGSLPTEGMLPLSRSMDCPGFLAATARDLALFLALAGGTTAAARERTVVAGHTVRVLEGLFRREVHPDVRSTVDSTARTFESLGVRIEFGNGHGIDDSRKVWMQVCCSEFADAHPNLLERADEVAPSVMEWLNHGRKSRSGATEVRREQIREWFRKRLAGADALLVPTTPFPAPKIPEAGDGVLDGTRDLVFEGPGPGWLTCPVNLAGLPVVSLPAGWVGGLPIGVSLIGSSGAEQTLLHPAAAWEEASGYHPTRARLVRP